jgi:hypothetical protein
VSEQTFEIPALPTTVDEFVALRNDMATTPFGGAVVYVVALVLYSNDPELGLQCLTVAVDASELTSGDIFKGKAPTKRRLRELKDRIAARPYLARSYFKGTTPENRYEIPSGPLSIQIRHQDRDVFTEDSAKVFVHSSGADSPRPITLKKNNRGVWKAGTYGSLDVGIRKPIEIIDDAL